jgi:hypothetical protein
MKPMRLAAAGFDLVTRRTHTQEFLDEMKPMIPWSALFSLIAPQTSSFINRRFPPHAGCRCDEKRDDVAANDSL